MPKIRCIRIIEIVGEPHNVQKHLNEAWLYPGVPREVSSGLVIKETQRVIQEGFEAIIIKDDEEIPF